MKLHPVKFGIAFGILYALVFFMFGTAAALFGWGAEFAEFIGVFYPGFGPSFAGALIGTVWGFGVGFLFFGLAAWIYNRLLGGSGAG
jgi:hypothetical protein